MATTDNTNNKQTNNKQTPNLFVRIINKIFVYEIGIKAIALGIAVFIWFAAVGLGSVISPSDAAVSDAAVGFWQSFGHDIAVCFTGGLNIFTSIVDMILTFLLTYAVIHFLYKSSSSIAAVFVGIFILAIVIFTSKLLNFPIMGSIFSNGILILIIALLVMFPQNIRRQLNSAFSKSGRDIRMLDYDCTEEEFRTATNEIVKAVLSMSKDNLGAIIIITPRTVPQHILDSGTRLNSQLSQPLIECLFNTHANLHDGAVFIHGNKILAAGCFLPLSQTQSIAKELGTRHRAAIGITEQYAVTAIVVSEETGIISVARSGVLERYYDASMLTGVIEETYGIKSVVEKKPENVKKRNRKK